MLKQIIDRGIKLSSFVPVTEGHFSVLKSVDAIDDVEPVKKKAKVNSDGAEEAQIPALSSSLPVVIQETAPHLCMNPNLSLIVKSVRRSIRSIRVELHF